MRNRRKGKTGGREEARNNTKHPEKKGRRTAERKGHVMSELELEREAPKKIAHSTIPSA